MTYLLHLVACLFLSVSLHSYASLLSIEGSIDYLDDPNNLLSSELGLNNINIGSEFFSFFSIQNPTITEEFVSHKVAEFQVYGFTDPGFDSQFEIVGNNPVSFAGYGRYIALAENVEWIPNALYGGDVFSIEAFLSPQIVMNLVLSDQSNNAINGNAFFFPQSLSDWDSLRFSINYYPTIDTFETLASGVVPNFSSIPLSSLQYSPVPLPAGIYLFLSGLLGLGLMRGRNG